MMGMFTSDDLKIATRWEMILAKIFGRTTYIYEDGFTWRFDQFRGNMYVSEVKQKSNQLNWPKF